jgi:hypothetical protein
MRYEIQTFTLCDSWVNCWSFDDGSPITFNDKLEAEAYLVGYGVDVNEAHRMGDLSDPFDENNYRIVEA